MTDQVKKPSVQNRGTKMTAADVKRQKKEREDWIETRKKEGRAAYENRMMTSVNKKI